MSAGIAGTGGHRAADTVVESLVAPMGGMNAATTVAPMGGMNAAPTIPPTGHPRDAHRRPLRCYGVLQLVPALETKVAGAGSRH